MPQHQLFDLPRRVAGGRTVSKIHCPVYPDGSADDHQHTLGESCNWGVNGTKRVSMESSTTSYSSNCSSSDLSLDSGQLQWSEVSSLERLTLPEVPPRNDLKNCSSVPLEDSLEESKFEQAIKGPAAPKESAGLHAKLGETSPLLKDITEGPRLSDVTQASQTPKRHVSVVAKLMGLDCFPESSRLSGTCDTAGRPEPEPNSPFSGVVHDSVAKTVSHSLFLKEATLGKQKKGANMEPLKFPVSKPVVNLSKQAKSSSSREDLDRVMIIERLKHPDNWFMQRAERVYEEDGVLLQQSSPVSVLDVFESIPDPLSPVLPPRSSLAEHCERHHGNINHDNGILYIIHKKLQNVGLLVQKLERLCSTHGEESSNFVAQLCECESPSPDQRYICQILISSGILLRDFSSGLSTCQLHPSGHPIDPGLFLVLEQREKIKSGAVEKDTSWRRITFDYVNEILGRKFADLGTANVWEKLIKETLSAQKLLRELFSEIIVMEAKMVIPSRDLDSDSNCCLKSILQDDMRQCKDKWTGFHVDKYELIIDLEQMIFGGLMDEIMFGDRIGVRSSIWCASHIGS